MGSGTWKSCVRASEAATHGRWPQLQCGDLISMLHHVAGPAAALSEARRILRDGGRIAVMAVAREDIEDVWFLDYFPSTWPWMHASHMPLAELLALLPGEQRHEIVLDDLKDGSLAALAAYPEKVLDGALRPATSSGCAATIRPSLRAACGATRTMLSGAR